MAYNFPTSPTDGQQYTGPDGAVFEWHTPVWYMVAPPIDFPVDEAPVDGKQYGRQDADWTEIIPPDPEISWDEVTDKPATFPPMLPIAWADVSGKPTTFPPTLPIPWADVSGKPSTFPPTVPIAWTDITGQPATYPPTLPIGWTDVAGKPSTYPPTLPIAWTDVSGKPTTFPPDLPIPWTDVSGKPTTFPPSTHSHPQSEVTNLTTDLAAKAPLASPVFTGNPTAPTPAVSDADLSIATTEFVSRDFVAKGGSTMTGPLTLNADPSSAMVAATKQYVDARPAIASIADTAPSSPTHGQLWWNSADGNMYIYYDDGTGTQWVQVNAIGT